MTRNPTIADLTATRRRVMTGMAAALLPPASVRAQEAITLRVAVHSAHAEMHRAIIEQFRAENPTINVDLDATQSNYSDLAQMLLRGAVTGSLPDVAFNGNNRLRIFISRKIAVPLDDLLETDRSASRQALPASIFAIGTFGDKRYGLGFTVSAPVVYYNIDLVRRAGANPQDLPTDWAGILDLARRINDPSAKTLGLFFAYDQLDWFWIALIESLGGRMMTADERRIAFNGPEGLRALELVRAFGEAGQAQMDMSTEQAAQLFAAGKMGIFANSSSDVGQYEKQAAGRFGIAVRRFPVPGPNGRLPAGGALSTMLARDPARRQAAWEYMKFASGPCGQTVVATHSGYMVANDLVARSPALLGSHFAKMPNMQAVIDELSLLDGWYEFPGSNGGKISDVIVQTMRDVVRLKRSPADALAAMSAEVTALLPLS